MVLAFVAVVGLGALVGAVPFPSKWEGTICVATKLSSAVPPKCEPYYGTKRMPAGSKHIEYYWTNEAGDALRVGSLDNADEVTLTSGDLGRISWRLAPLPPRKGLSTATVELRRDGGDDWNLRLPFARLASVAACYLPPGTYSIQIRTGNFRRIFRRGISVVEEKNVDLGKLPLEPLPEISGTVVTGADREALPGAAILVGEARVAITDGRGHFAFSPEDDVPPAITVRSDGYSDTTVPVVPSRQGFELQPITLTRGSTATFRVNRSCANNCATSLSLKRLDLTDPPQQWKSVAERNVLGQNPTFKVERLQPGDYAAVFSGTGPLQRKVVRFTVSESPVEQDVTLSEGRLKGVLSRGHTLLGNESISFSGPTALWTSSVSTASDGQYDVATWRPELLFASVARGTQRFRVSRAFGDAEEYAWDIWVPSNEIKGRVTDSSTGAAVANATVSDAIVSGTWKHGPIPLTVGPDGTFSLEMLPTGIHRLQATANGYLDSAPIDVELTTSDERRTIDIPLNAGVAIKLTFVDDDGNPAPNVLVFDSFGTDGFSTTRVLFANALGELEYHVGRAQRRGLYALTDKGSFAVVVADAANPKPSPVTLVAPTATLDLVAMRGKHPVPAMSFLVRFNGFFLPPGFFDQVTMMARTKSVTDAGGHLFLPRLPPGLYELWPFANYGAYRDLLSNVNVSEPHARIAVAPGENVATVPVELGR